MHAAQEISYRWHPIEDLPEDYSSLVRPELKYLAEVWASEKDSFSLKARADFLERLQRRWAIETGIIERIYSLDRGITEMLIAEGIKPSLIPQSSTDKDPQLVAAIIQDQKDAVEGLFDFVKGNRELSTSYIKELHSVFTRNQLTTVAQNMFGRQLEVALIRGEYKKLPNNPRREDGSIHEYCPPEHVASEMDALLRMHHEHAKRKVPPEVEAAWLHHRFSQIHPFQDGNGRVARALASLVFIRAGWFPLSVSEEQRSTYIAACEKADFGDLKAIVELFVAIQKKYFVSALSIAAEVQQQHQADLLIKAAKQDLDRRQTALNKEFDKAKVTANRLHEIAGKRFGEIVANLKAEIGRTHKGYRFSKAAANDGDARSRYYYFQIVQTAKELNYYANTDVFRAWDHLVFIKDNQQSDLLISFHGLGREFKGIIVASACYFRRAQSELKSSEFVDLTTVSDEVFQINYRESQHDIELRFYNWLEDCIVKALQMWRSAL